MPTAIKISKTEIHNLVSWVSIIQNTLAIVETKRQICVSIDIPYIDFYFLSLYIIMPLPMCSMMYPPTNR